MYLDTISFSKALLDVVDCGPKEDAVLEQLISVAPEEERESLREQYFFDQRIMRARCMGDIADISLEKLLQSLGSYGLFFELYDRPKAKVYFYRFYRVATVKTCRKRRIL